MTTPAVVAPDPFAGFSEPMRWLLARVTPSEPAIELLKPEQSLDAIYSAWLAAGETDSALRLIASVLPARESVWWAWVSARYAVQASTERPSTAEVHATLTAVEQWIVRPDDEARMRAWEAGNLAGLETPVGMVSAAVFLNGVSIAPAGAPPVPPPPGAAVPIVAGAIISAAASIGKADQVDPTMRAFAAQGMEIIKKLGGWESALQSASETFQRQQQEYIRATAPSSNSSNSN